MLGAPASDKIATTMPTMKLFQRVPAVMVLPLNDAVEIAHAIPVTK
jgi:hypothetical protein